MENQRALSLSKTLPRHRHRPKKKERKRCERICSRCSRYLAFGRVSSEVFNAPSHKMGGAKMCSGVVVRFGEKCALVWFFSHEFIRPNFLSSVVDCITKHTKRGESRALTRIESASEKCNAEEARVNKTNSPVVGTVENEIDFFSVRRPFRSTLCWLNAYRGERSSISSNVSNFFPSFICVDRAVEREKKSQKSRGRTHRQKGRLKFFFFKLVLLIFSLSLSPV